MSALATPMSSLSSYPTVLGRRGKPLNPFKKPFKYQMGLLLQQGERERQNREAERGVLFPKFQELAGSEGYAPEERQAILGGALSGIGGAYGAAREELGNLSARTRNRAGYGSRVMELARAEGREKAQAGFGVQKLFADEKMRRQLLGLEGLARLYGVDTNFLANLMGMRTSSLTQRKLLAEQKQGGPLDAFKGITEGLANLGDLFKVDFGKDDKGG